MKTIFTLRSRRRHGLLRVVALALLTSACATTQRPQVAQVAPVPAPAASIRPVQATPAREDLATVLAALAPQADPAVLRYAVQAQQCAVASGAVTEPERLAVIDYSRPSTVPRLWVFDLRGRKLLYSEHVAHGKHSGANLANAFSNVEGSFKSSLGLFSAAETYVGGNGYSLRMDGLEPGFNDRARERLLVIHGADYVNPVQAKKQGRLGRSYGCPALRRAVADGVIDSLKDGQLVFAYYPDTKWLGSSRFLNCAATASAKGPTRG